MSATHTTTTTTAAAAATNRCLTTLLLPTRREIMIPYNIVGPQKLRRLAELVTTFPSASISVSADSQEVIDGLAFAARHAQRLRGYQTVREQSAWDGWGASTGAGPAPAGVAIGVLIELDSGSARTGAQSPREAVDLAAAVVRAGP